MRIKGYCPMGCGATLQVGERGYIVCTGASCPAPAPVSDILGDGVTDHIVTFTEDVFTVKHPLRERLDDALLTCEVGDHLAGWEWGPPRTPGTYRMFIGEKGFYVYERVVG